MGRLGAILEGSEVVKDGTKTKNRNVLKLYVLRKELDHFRLSGPSVGTNLKVL